MRDSRLNMIGEGSNEVLRAFIGAVGVRDVGMQLKTFADSFKPPFSTAKVSLIFKTFKSFLRYFKKPRVPVQTPALNLLANQLSKAVQRFARSIPKLLGKYKEEIVEAQLILDRITTCALSLYAMTASLSKLDSDLVNKTKEPHALKADFNSVSLFFKEQSILMNQCFESMHTNHDAMITSLSDQLTGVQFPKKTLNV